MSTHAIEAILRHLFSIQEVRSKIRIHIPVMAGIGVIISVDPFINEGLHQGFEMHNCFYTRNVPSQWRHGWF